MRGCIPGEDEVARMYRIEIRPGEETVFRSIEELATGIRNGFITPRARIYHAASQKWLPVEFHPHYKKALKGDFTPAPMGSQPSLGAAPVPSFVFPAAAPPPAIASPVPPLQPAPTTAPPVTTAAESPVLAMRASVVRPQRDSGDPLAEADGLVERYSPVAVLEAPRPATAAQVVLPNITYPELPPMEQPEPRATARRSRRGGGRPLLLVGSAAVLVLAGQRYLGSRGSDPAATAPQVETPASPAPRVEPRAPAAPGSAKPRPATASRSPAVTTRRPDPVVVPPTQPMIAGPAFAASVPATGAEIARPSATVQAPPPAATSPGSAPRPDAAIAPAPAAMELDVPVLLPGESIGPKLTTGRDSLALKRILKAVTGPKANPAAP